MACPVQLGDTLAIELTIRQCDSNAILDISTQTAMSITIVGPSSTPGKTVNSVFVTDGTDGKMTSTFLKGVISIIGKWSLQGLVVLPTGTHHTNIETFEVKANL